MLGLGAGQLDAQVSVRVNKDNKGKSVEVKVGESGRGKSQGRDEGRRDHGRSDDQRDRGIGQERVWVVDYEMVEERYFQLGHWTTVEKQVWVPDQHVKTIERVWVPEKHVKVIERVWIPGRTEMVEETVYVAGQHVTRRVARRDCHGRIYYTNECVWVPAHYEKKMVEKCIPGRYEDREVCKVVPGHYVDKEVCKVIPGHYKTVCEKVFVEGCYKTRMVKRECGGHWEVKKPDPCKPCQPCKN
ncbi:MAG: hypothetical protein DCC64_09360 [Planctomycetota bacterium]|nr:MAG: hypothetical protein DCC64_09360 [Planctomycetota bacterium]